MCNYIHHTPSESLKGVTIDLKEIGQQNTVNGNTIQEIGQGNAVQGVTVGLKEVGQHNTVEGVTIEEIGQSNTVNGNPVSLKEIGQQNAVEGVTVEEIGQNNNINGITIQEIGQGNAVQGVTVGLTEIGDNEASKGVIIALEEIDQEDTVNGVTIQVGYEMYNDDTEINNNAYSESINARTAPVDFTLGRHKSILTQTETEDAGTEDPDVVFGGLVPPVPSDDDEVAGTAAGVNQLVSDQAVVSYILFSD